MKTKEDNIKHLFGSLKKDNPFRVPENYFETFTDRLNDRIDEEAQRSKKRSIFVILNPILKFAAVFAIAMLLVYIPLKKYFPAVQENLVQNPPTKTFQDLNRESNRSIKNNYPHK